jgi:hypothetical protein
LGPANKAKAEAALTVNGKGVGYGKGREIEKRGNNAQGCVSVLPHAGLPSLFQSHHLLLLSLFVPNGIPRTYQGREPEHCVFDTRQAMHARLRILALLVVMVVDLM